MPGGRVDQKQMQSRAGKALKDQRVLTLERSPLRRPWVGQAGMRGRGGRTSPDSDQRVGGLYPRAVSEALRLYVGTSLGRAVELDL